MPNALCFDTFPLQKQAGKHAKRSRRLTSLSGDFEFCFGDVAEVELSLHVVLDKSQTRQLFPKAAKLLWCTQTDWVV